MNHSPSEIEALQSSIEVVSVDNDFKKEIITSLEKGHTQTHEHTQSRRRITILSQSVDYRAVFDQAGSVISNMRAAYEEMFGNWKLESDINSRLAKEVENLNVTIEGQRKITKMVLNEKSQLQEQLEKAEKKPKLQSRVEDLETELTSLKLELEQLKTDKARQNNLMDEKTRTLDFYRQEFGFRKEEEEMAVAFRPRVIPIKRTNSGPTHIDRRVSKHGAERKNTGPSKLFSIISGKC